MKVQIIHKIHYLTKITLNYLSYFILQQIRYIIFF